MFAMLRGPWPRRTSTGVDIASLETRSTPGGGTAAELDVAIGVLVEDAVRAQLEAGCEPVSDGSVRWADPVRAVLDAMARGDVGPGGMLARAFRDTSERARALTADVPAPSGLTVAAAVPGPWTLAVRDVGESGGRPAVSEVALSFAGVLAGELQALRDAGCSLVVVDEAAATAVDAEQARDGWFGAHRRLLRDAAGLHVMLAITGGDAKAIGGTVIGALPYASVLVDLVDGPDNWYVVRDLPGDRGVVCAALAAGAGRPLGDQSPQLVWAAHYAASMRGRGLARVGLANASSLADLSPAEAQVALEMVARAAQFAVMGTQEALEAGFDERAWRAAPGPAPGRRP